MTKGEALLLGGVLAAVLVVCLPKLGNGFVYDDLYVIPQGEVIHDFANLPAVFAHHTMYSTYGTGQALPAGTVDTYRPVTLLTFFIDSALTGKDPLAYHLDNMLAHLSCVALVFFLARRLLPEEKRAWAAFAAAFFGLSPELTEAHVWINGRSDVYCALFGVAALLVWRRAVERPERDARALLLQVMAGVLLLLAALSKEIALLLLVPAATWPRGRDEPEGASSLRRRALTLLPLGIAAALYLGVRVAVLGGMRASGGGLQTAHALLRLPSLWLDGLSALFLPTQVYLRSLVDDYNELGPALLGVRALAVVMIAVVAWRYRARARLACWCLLAFAATLAPATMITTVLWPGFGRYLYVPAIFVGIALAELLPRAAQALAPRRLDRVVRIAAVAYLGVLGARTAVMVFVFHDEESLYTHVIECAPERAHGYGWLGMTMIEQRRYAEAVTFLDRAQARATHQPRYLRALGEAFLAEGDVPSAMYVSATGIGRFGNDAGPFHLLAFRALADSNQELAARHLLQCERLCPACQECAEARRAVEADPVRGAIYAPLFEQLRGERVLVEPPRAITAPP